MVLMRTLLLCVVTTLVHQYINAQELQPTWTAPYHFGAEHEMVEGQSVLVYNTKKEIMARSTADGKVLWTKTEFEDPDDVMEELVRLDSNRYCLFDDGMAQILDLHSGNVIRSFQNKRATMSEYRSATPQGGISIIRLADSTWIVDHNSGDIVSTIRSVQSLYPNAVDSTLVIETSREILKLHTETKSILSRMKLDYDWELADRVMEPVLHGKVYTLFLCEDTLYSVNTQSGSVAWKRAWDPTDPDNVKVLTVGANRLCLISQDDQHKFYSMENGQELSLKNSQPLALKGSLDMIHQLSNGAVGIVTFDNDDNMILTVIDAKLSVMAVHTLGFGEITHRTGYPGWKSAFVSFLNTNNVRVIPGSAERYLMRHTGIDGTIKLHHYATYMQMDAREKAQRSRDKVAALVFAEARRPQNFSYMTDNFYYRSAYAELVPLGKSNGDDVFLLAGNIAIRDGEKDVDESQSAEGVYSINPTTGAVTKRVGKAIYHHEDIWSYFDVHYVGQWYHYDEQTLVVIADYGVSIVTQDSIQQFKTKLMKVENYSDDPYSMMIFDKDENDMRYVRYIGFDENGAVESGIIAKTDEDILQITKKQDVPKGAYTFIDDELTIYQHRASWNDEWDPANIVKKYSEDELDNIGLGGVRTDKMLNFSGLVGIRTFEDGLFYFGDDAVGTFSFAKPSCSGIFWWDAEKRHNQVPKAIHVGNNKILVATTGSMIELTGNPFCNPTVQLMKAKNNSITPVWDEPSKTLLVLDEYSQVMTAIR